MSLVDLFKGTIKDETQLVEVSIPNRKITCVSSKCNRSYMSDDVKLYAHARPERCLCICPECGKQFSIKRVLTDFTVSESSMFVKHETEEQIADREAKKEEKRQQREAEAEAKRKQREADKAYLEEEARREKEERLAAMSPEARRIYEEKLLKMKKAREAKQKRSQEVDNDYL